MKEKYNLGLNWHLTSVWGIFNKPEWIFFFFLFFFQLGKYSVNTKPFDTFDFFFSQYFCSAATKETLFTTVLKKKADLNIPEDIDSDITNSGITEEKRPLPPPGHAPKALLVFCEGRARSERLSGPSWEHTAGSMTAMFSVLFLQMKPRNFVPV